MIASCRSVITSTLMAAPFEATRSDGELRTPEPPPGMHRHAGWGSVGPCRTTSRPMVAGRSLDHPEHFLDGGEAVPDLEQPVLLQRDHAVALGGPPDRVGGGALHDQAFDLLGHRHDLVEPHAAPVARVRA